MKGSQLADSRSGGDAGGAGYFVFTSTSERSSRWKRSPSSSTPETCKLQGIIASREKNGLRGRRSFATRRATRGTSVSVVRTTRPWRMRNRRGSLHAVHLVPAFGKPSRVTDRARLSTSVPRPASDGRNALSSTRPPRGNAGNTTGVHPARAAVAIPPSSPVAAPGRMSPGRPSGVRCPSRSSHRSPRRCPVRRRRRRPRPSRRCFRPRCSRRPGRPGW